MLSGEANQWQHLFKAQFRYGITKQPYTLIQYVLRSVTESMTI